MIHIRPYQLLSITDNFDDEIKFFMPPPDGSGGLRTLESMLLIKLLRIVVPKFIFEFGTYRGETTRLLLENLPDSECDVESERIYTLDLPDIDNVVFQGSDKIIAEKALGFSRKYLTSTKSNLVKQIFQDSMKFEPEDFLHNKFQYIFIDANHEVSYVKKDTENATKMLADAPSCIIWHDYGNPEFPELTQYLDELSNSMELYHVENTMLVFYLLGKDVPPPRV
jgi:hypothetical protein